MSDSSAAVLSNMSCPSKTNQTTSAFLFFKLTMKYTTWLHVQENICDKGSLPHTILPPLHNILLCQYECMTFTYKNGDLDRAQCLQNAIYRSSLEGNYCYCFDDASFQGAYNCTLNNQIYFSSTLII